MNPAVVVLTLGLALAGFGALRLSLPRHHEAAFAAASGRRRVVALRTGGWVALALSLVAAIRFEGGAFGPVLWCGALTAAALAVAVAASYRPRLGWWAILMPLLVAAAAFAGLSVAGS
ncbi:DUF3325 domain-containing protein [Methylobacterium oryzihabitans]|uniref:DUF3325 domain-containing protein n=1 Tax=Methylobacterium oryzihabitans TaxID=2499852 RepID=A0A437P215_9HYPH|nr:DUF3325 domain-containing protein [Methylobacterium oryzihabitans]RVU16339.1 DUF3325 domain-containing protein [Methylobacterium oryzihabitans]